MANFAIPVWVPGTPGNAQILLKFKANFDFTVPANMAGTKTTCDNNPTGAATFTIAKNGTSIGTVQFQTNGTATLAGAGASFAAASNDVFTLTAPTTADATLSFFSINILSTVA
jgi:hypothetical protein